MTKYPKYLRRYDPNQDASANWKDADLLKDSWFHYGPSELRERYRDSGRNLSLSKCLELDMKREVQERIEDEEILAFGVQQLPELKIEAERIPAILFQSKDVEIDWERGRISCFGREFHDVRICVWADENDCATAPILPSAPASKRGGGRPNQYPKAKEILEFLFKDKSFQGMTSNELLEPFRKEFQKRFRDQRIAPISERSLRDHLKRYRQELARTGNN